MAAVLSLQGCSLKGSLLEVGDETNASSTDVALKVQRIAGPETSVGSKDGSFSDARLSDSSGFVMIGSKVYSIEYAGTLRSIDLVSSVVSTVAGSRTYGFQDGAALSAKFNGPLDMCTDGTDIFVADTGNHLIRKVSLSTGVVSTIAGTVGVSGAQNGVGTAAQFNRPFALGCNGTNLYVSDFGNNLIRKIDLTTNTVTTLAGTGVAGLTNGAATVAKFNKPCAGVYYGGFYYSFDYGTRRIRVTNVTTGAVTTLAGGGTLGADGTGTSAGFYYNYKMVTDGTYLYLTEGGYVSNVKLYGKIRRVTISSGQAVTIAGSGSEDGYVDGLGTAARFKWPQALALDGSGYLYISDKSTSIRKMNLATTEVVTVVGKTGTIGSVDGVGSVAKFNNSFYGRLVADGEYVYVCDSGNATIRRVELSTGTVTTLAGSAGLVGSTDGTGSAARFGWPTGIAVLGDYLYVTDAAYHNIRKIHKTTGVTTTLAGPASGAGTADGVGSAARFDFPSGIVAVGSMLYVVDSNNATIRSVDPSTGSVTTIAGTVGTWATTDGVGLSAAFNGPWAITSDNESLFITDFAYTIRKVRLSDNYVSTFVGQVDVSGSADGDITQATFGSLNDITTDGQFLYVSDGAKIRKISIATGDVSTPVGSSIEQDETGTVSELQGVLSALGMTFSAKYGIIWFGVSSIGSSRLTV